MYATFDVTNRIYIIIASVDLIAQLQRVFLNDVENFFVFVCEKELLISGKEKGASCIFKGSRARKKKNKVLSLLIMVSGTDT